MMRKIKIGQDNLWSLLVTFAFQSSKTLQTEFIMKTYALLVKPSLSTSGNQNLDKRKTRHFLLTETIKQFPQTSKKKKGGIRRF